MAKVYVKGIPRDYTDQALTDIFRSCAEIKSIQRNERAAVVEFLDIGDARRAIDTLQGRRLSGSAILSLDMYYHRNKRVAVRNTLPREDIEKALSQFGPLYNVKETPLYLYADYSDEKDAQKALQSGIRVGDAGESIAIRRVTTEKASPEQTVFIYNLPGMFSTAELSRMFEKYGEILSCGVNGSRGYVNYSKPISALKAFKGMNGKKVIGKRVAVKIKSGMLNKQTEEKILRNLPC